MAWAADRYDLAKGDKDADTINVKRITRRAATGG
jgi:hypothetical protein